MPPTGHLKRYLRDAMEKLEQKRVRGKPLRPQTLRAYARRMAVIGDWFTDRAATVNASNLLLAVADASNDQNRKEAITVARYLAHEAGVNLEIPAHLRPVKPLPPQW